MAFEMNRRGEFSDAGRGLTVVNRGGHQNRSNRDIVGDGWVIGFSYENLYPPRGDAFKLTRLRISQSYGGSEDDARALIYDYLDALRNLPHMLEGRTGPKQILL